MDGTHAAVGTGAAGSTALVADVLAHFQGVQIDTATSEAGLLVLAAGVLGHLGWKLLTHWWPWLGQDQAP